MQNRALSKLVQFSYSSEFLCHPHSNNREREKLYARTSMSRYINHSVTVCIPTKYKPLLLASLVQKRCILPQFLILGWVRPEPLIIYHLSGMHQKRYNSRPILSLPFLKLIVNFGVPLARMQDNHGLLMEGWLGPCVPALLGISYHFHCNSVLVL